MAIFERQAPQNVSFKIVQLFSGNSKPVGISIYVFVSGVEESQQNPERWEQRKSSWAEKKLTKWFVTQKCLPTDNKVVYKDERSIWKWQLKNNWAQFVRNIIGKIFFPIKIFLFILIKIWPIIA